MSVNAWTIEELCWNESVWQWILDRYKPRGNDVSTLIPSGFDAYARVFHPAKRTVDRKAHRSVDVGWRIVAAANKKVAHPGMQWGSIVGNWAKLGNEGLWDKEPDIGTLPESALDAIAKILSENSRIDDTCYFGFWEGHSYSELPMLAPRLTLSIGPLLVFSGEISAVTRKFQSETPSVWWPSSHEWFVSTDIDLMTTFIGGSRQCIEALTSHRAIEAMKVPFNQGLAWDSDDVNPLPPGAYQFRKYHH